MTVRFRVAESKELVPANACDKIRAHLEQKGHRTIGGYISFHGLVDVTFADTNSVDVCAVFQLLSCAVVIKGWIARLCRQSNSCRKPFRTVRQWS
jgi:hypothetical protein